MEQRENEAELTMQELVSLINATEGDFIYGVSPGGEVCDGREKSDRDRQE